LIDWGYAEFRTLQHRFVWAPLLVTPAVAALAVWLTRTFFRGAEGSGIPQVIATLHSKPGEYGARLLSFRILFGKIAVSFLGILGGFTIGREGPTVQVGAALMFNLRRLYPRSNALIERQLVLAGAAAGLSAAFNTPLAGIVFAIEELTRSFEARASGVVITAIIIAGVIALGLNGNYTYFGTIQIGVHFPDLLALAVLLTAVVTGIAGGVFGWLLLNTARWIPAPLRQLHGERPVVFAALCGFTIAVVGLISGGTTFGSGYAEARGLLDGHEQLSVFYPFLKMIAMIGSYLPGIPGVAVDRRGLRQSAAHGVRFDAIADADRARDGRLSGSRHAVADHVVRDRDGDDQRPCAGDFTDGHRVDREPRVALLRAAAVRVAGAALYGAAAETSARAGARSA
jgi:H+/Cl- antiporter ClcA